MQTYPGRASMAPLLDVLMTLLHWGVPGWAAALAAREELFQYAQQALSAFAERHGERLLHTPNNPISLALTLDSLGRAGSPGSAGGPMGDERCLERGSVSGCGRPCGSAEGPAHEASRAAGAEPGEGGSAVGASIYDRVRKGTDISSTLGGAGNGEEGMEPAVGGNVDMGSDVGSRALGPGHARECAAGGQALASNAGAPEGSRSAGAADPLDPGRRPPDAAEAHPGPGLQPASEHAAQESAAERGAPAGPLPVGAAGSGPAAQPPPAAFLGSMLFKRCVSGTRVVARGSRAEVAGHAFAGYGAHCDAYPHDYLTFAAALGTTRADVDAFVRRLEQCFAEFRARRGSGGSATV